MSNDVEERLRITFDYNITSKQFNYTVLACVMGVLGYSNYPYANNDEEVDRYGESYILELEARIEKMETKLFAMNKEMAAIDKEMVAMGKEMSVMVTVMAKDNLKLIKGVEK